MELFMAKASGIPVKVIRINLNDPRVHVNLQVAKGLPYGTEEFSTFIARSKPTIAINGAYALLRPTCVPLETLWCAVNWSTAD